MNIGNVIISISARSVIYEYSENSLFISFYNNMLYLDFHTNNKTCWIDINKNIISDVGAVFKQNDDNEYWE